MLKTLKITIVEDETPIRNMYKYKLEAAGYEVSIAIDGKDGIEVIGREKPDLVLLDIKMPKLPGQEVLRWLRSTKWGANTKVIVLTNISKSEAPAEFRFMQVDQYIIKAHYTPTQVLQIVEQVLAK